MSATRRRFTLAMALALVPLLGACGTDTEVEDDLDLDVPPAAEVTTEDALRVTDVDVGRSIGSDGRVNDNDEADEFGPNDTIYVSVDTEGTASGASLTARWSFEDGQVVDEQSQPVSSATTGSVTEFHISMPDGLPPGEYEVAILLDGRVVETEDFTVR